MDDKSMKLYLLKLSNGDIDKAKEAYEFVKNDNKSTDNTESVPKDGVYILYGDGHDELFDGNNSKIGTVGIVVRIGERVVIVSKYDDSSDDDNIQLFDDNMDGEAEPLATDYYTAYSDMDGERHTDSLIDRGCKVTMPINNHIPSIGEWMVVLMYFNKVQEVMRYIYGQKLRNGLYWSSTEYSNGKAWLVNTTDGSIIRDENVETAKMRLFINNSNLE